MENPVVIFGAKGLGVTAQEIFQSNNHLIYCFLDDDETLHGNDLNMISVLGSTDDEGFLKLIGKKCDAFVALENSKAREVVTEMLLNVRKVMPVNAIHNRSYISTYATLGFGNLIAAGASIGANTTLGSHCIVHTNATIDYEVVVDDFVQIGAGSVINSGVKVEKGVFIGSGVVIISGVKIGKNARIGAGSVVMNDIKAGTIVFGVPALEVKN